MSKVEPISTPPARAEARSPFVRLAELLANVTPGQPPINLSVGEPQHPIPPFVGPVLAAHLNDFGRYPANKGTERFRRAAAAWLDRRYDLPRPLDAESEILVLNGTREGLFLAAMAAARRPTARRAAGHSHSTVLCRLRRRRDRGRLRAGVSGVDAGQRLPARSRHPRRHPAPPHRGPLSRVAVQSAGRRGEPRLPERLVALARQYGFLIFSDECYSEIYTQHPPHGMLEVADRITPT